MHEVVPVLETAYDVATVEPAKALPDGRQDDRTLAALAASSSSSLPIQHSGALDDGFDETSPSFLLVASLRSQITDLTSQVTSLNAKLVSSYTRIGDLEDDLHDATEEAARHKAKITALETDKRNWETEIARGGWVEKDHVQIEMQRLMVQVVEETKSRESAVQAHGQLETEIDNLTSSLFSEANRMVASERFARAVAEEKMRSLEESGKDMSGLLDELQKNLRDKIEKLEEREAEVDELRRRLAAAGSGEREVGDEALFGESSGVLFSDGKNVTAASGAAAIPSAVMARQPRSLVVTPRLLTSVLPHHEFLAFISYLRQLRVAVLSRPPETGHPYVAASTFSARTGFGASLPYATNGGTAPHATTHAATASPTPAQLLIPHLPLSSHIAQPFLKRCIEEDSDPALRLDLAPGLGFLSRRNVGTAILDGTLRIEPTYSNASLPSSTCALCGTSLERWFHQGDVVVVAAAKPGVNQTMRKVLGSGSWAISNFTGGGAKKDMSASASPPSSASVAPAGSEAPLASTPEQEQIHIVRTSDTSTTRYAVCPIYCLPRLRAVCEFWTYVRAMERGLLLEEGFKFVAGWESAPRSGAVTPKEVVEEIKLDPGTVKDGGDDIALGEKVDGVEPIDGNEAEAEAEKVASELVVEEEEVDEVVAEGPDSEVAVVAAEEKPKEDEDSAPTPPARLSTRTPPATLSSSSSSPSTDSRQPLRRTASAPPPRPPRHPRTAAKVVAAGPSADAQASIIDSATGWEDRCWTEVIRLKENVFWARMAAVDAEGSAVGSRETRV